MDNKAVATVQRQVDKRDVCEDREAAPSQCWFVRGTYTESRAEDWSMYHPPRSRRHLATTCKLFSRGKLTLSAAEVRRPHVLDYSLDALLKASSHVGAQQAELDVQAGSQEKPNASHNLYSHLRHAVVGQVVTSSGDVGRHVRVSISDHLLGCGGNADQADVRVV